MKSSPSKNDISINRYAGVVDRYAGVVKYYAITISLLLFAVRDIQMLKLI